MIDWLASLTWWQWLVGAFVLAALEALLPGAVMIWFAISAAVIGMLLVVVPLPCIASSAPAPGRHPSVPPRLWKAALPPRRDLG